MSGQQIYWHINFRKNPFFARVGSVAQDRIPLWQSELYVPEAHALELPLMPGGSLYTKIGDVFARACLILTGLPLILARRRG